jgi:lipoprotein-releasing system permease protein
MADLWGQFKKDKAAAPNSGLLNTVSVQSWKEYRRAVVAPMEQEQLILSLMFVLVGITTVFIVFVVFYMIVNNKRKDIGVLKSVGASNTGVLSLFQGFAFGIGSVGSCAGVLFAWLFLSRINQIEQWSYKHLGIQLWDRTIYVIGDIPNHVEPSVLAVIVSCAILSCLAGALVPSYLAVRLRPVETLHAGRT